MALNWVRLDAQFPTNPKVLELVEGKNYRAALVYVCSLAQCGAHETDGFVPKPWLPFIHATAREATALVDAGLWRPCRGGWEIPDWSEYQPTSSTSQARTEKAKKAAAARWAKKAGGEPTDLKAVK